MQLKLRRTIRWPRLPLAPRRSTHRAAAPSKYVKAKPGSSQRWRPPLYETRPQAWRALLAGLTFGVGRQFGSVDVADRGTTKQGEDGRAKVKIGARTQGSGRTF